MGYMPIKMLWIPCVVEPIPQSIREHTVRLKRAVAIFAVLLLGPVAHGGAWDTGPFDNDDALDWVWELEESTDLSVVKAALEAVSKSGSYIEAPTASAALAAAEVVAALKGNPHAQLPEEVTAWADARSLGGNEDLVALAIEVVERVQDSSDSELAQLWSDSEELRDSWAAGLADLEKRLQ